MKIRIKSLLFVAFTVCFSVMSVAQNKSFTLSGYIKDAVPMVDGRVVFSREINTSKFKGDELKVLVNTWLKGFVKGKKDDKSKVVIEDLEKGQMVAVMDDWLVFSHNAISLDRATVRYQLMAEVSDEKCVLTVEKIRFNYRDDNYKAAEMISDKVALNKKGTNIQRGYKKWRVKSLDYFRGIFTSLEEYLEKERVNKILKENS